MKILVIEDSAGLQTSLDEGLRGLGYVVDLVTDSGQAITYARERDYDLIILDLMLPKDSSLLVLHEIRESNREVEILVLSARDQIHDRVTALIQGADDYMVYPFSFDDINARIQTLTGRKLVHETQGDRPASANDASAHLNRLIQNLLKLCQCSHGAIELVISETRLSDLLTRVQSNLETEIEEKNIALQLPVQKLPTLLIDSRWMEHLLTNLLRNAIIHSPAKSSININFDAEPEYCALTIENQMSDSFCSDEVKAMYKEFRERDHNGDNADPITCLSLVKSYADCMNLGLNAEVNEQYRLRIRISNIKIV